MKEITLVQEYRVTYLVKNAADGFADGLLEDAKINVSDYVNTVKKSLGVDHVELIKTQVFELDRSESAEEKKRREIRELTERLQKLISE